MRIGEFSILIIHWIFKRVFWTGTVFQGLKTCYRLGHKAMESAAVSNQNQVLVSGTETDSLKPSISTHKASCNASNETSQMFCFGYTVL